MDNIALGADGRANHAISTLRLTNRTGDLVHNVTFIPGLTLHIAHDLEVSGRWRSEEGVALDLEATLLGDNGWAALHIAMPFESTVPYGMLGFAARTQASTATESRICLRSGVESGFEDTFFEQNLVFLPQETSHLGVLEFHNYTSVPQRAPWRDLIVFLPAHSFSLRLIDFRIFLV